MRHFFKTFTLKDYVTFGIIAVCYLLLLLQSYPISNDDFTYIFHQSTDLPITSFSELIDSNIWGYLNVNGRFLVHCFVQGCLNNYAIFYICSFALFYVLIMSVTYLIRRSTHVVKGDTIYALAGMICLLPLMATLLYGTVAMTINYIWSAAIYTFFLSIYFHVKDDNVDYTWWQNVVLMLFALACGSWQESYCIGIAGSLCIYHLFKLRKTSKSTYFLLIGFGLGAIILILAPGNFTRVEGRNWIGMSAFVYDLVQLLKHTWFVHVWWVVGIISVVVDIIKYHRLHFVRENWLFFVSAFIAFIFSTYTISIGAYQGKWQLTILAVWGVILFVRFITYYFGGTLNEQCKYLPLLLLFLILIWYLCVYSYRVNMQRDVSLFTHTFVQSKSDTIYDGELQYKINNQVPNHEFIFEQICPMYLNFYNAKMLKNMSRFYTNGKEEWGCCILPEPIDSIALRCLENGKVETQLSYAVVRYPKDHHVVEKEMKIYYTSKYPIDKLKDKLRRRNVRVMAYDLNTLLCVEDEGYVYYIKYLDWWMYHNKNVKYIEVDNE